MTSLDLHPLQRVIPDGSVLRVIDLETTGVDPATAMIVQIAMIVLHPSGEIQRWCSLVDPEIPIPAEATTIHGITDERVRGARTWARLAPQLAPKLESAVIGGYNVRAYDLAVLDAACRRVGVSFDPERPLVLDALEIWRRHEPRDLASALRYYIGAHEARAESESPEPTGAHDAAGDAWDALRLLAAQLAQYEDLPRTARELDAYGLDLAEGALDPDCLDAESGHGASPAAARAPPEQLALDDSTPAAEQRHRLSRAHPSADYLALCALLEGEPDPEALLAALVAAAPRLGVREIQRLAPQLCGYAADAAGLGRAEVALEAAALARGLTLQQRAPIAQAVLERRAALSALEVGS